MLLKSFRLVTACLIPQACRRKQAFLFALVLILAGCGGSPQKNAPSAWKTLHLAAARFQVPAAWKVGGSRLGTKASAGSDQIEVDTFPLVHPYTAALFTKVEPELAKVVSAVAKRTGGTLAGSQEVTAGAIRSHSYDVRVGKRTFTYTFVLRGMREYELVCSAGDDVCAHLLASFAVA
jgi:hypothetical protein